MHTPRSLLTTLAIATATSFASPVLAPEAKALYTLSQAYQQERDIFTRDPLALGFDAKGTGVVIDSITPSRWVGLVWQQGMLRAVDLESATIGPLGWEDTTVFPSLRTALSSASGVVSRDTILTGSVYHLWSRTLGDTLWNIALDTTNLRVFAQRRVGTTWSTMGLDSISRASIDSNSNTYLNPEARSLYSLSQAYKQERDRFTRDLMYLGYESKLGSGALIDSITPSLWVGLVWQQGMLRAVDLESAKIGPLGWEDTAAILGLRTALSSASGVVSRDTILTGNVYHLWSHTLGDTLWNIALDTTSLRVFAQRRVGTTWSTLGLDTLPWWKLVTSPASDLMRAKMQEVRAEFWERDSVSDILSSDTCQSLHRIWQTTTKRDSGVALIWNPSTGDFAIGKGEWTSESWGRSTRDRAAFAAPLQAWAKALLARKMALPTANRGWVTESDTLKVGDSTLALSAKIFTHQDTTVLLVTEMDGASGFAWISTASGVTELGVGPETTSLRRTAIKPAPRKIPSVDIQGRPRKGEHLGITQVRLPNH